MSRQPPIQPEQGSYSQFQLETSQPTPPRRRDKDILTKLRDSIPQNESQWQQTRQLRGYATAEHVLEKTKAILENRIDKQDLRNFMSIATCCIYWHLGRKKEAYAFFKSSISFATELTIQRYMSSVRGMIQAMDTVYRQGMRHRVFEAILLYSRIGPSFLNYYTKDADEFSSCFPASVRTEPEIQASLALSPAFILKHRHTELSYEAICKALGTDVLNEEAYSQFVSVLESGRPVPYVLSLPEQALQPGLSAPAGGDEELEADLPDDLQLDDIFALPKSFALLFRTFNTSETLQQLVEEASEQVDRQRPQEVPNTPLLELQWTAYHDVVVDQLVGDLIQQGILPQQPFRRYKSFYRHEPGSISVLPGWIKVIVPALVDGGCQVSIAGPTLEQQDINWNNKMGVILGEGMRLSTSRTIFYSSVSIPLSSNTGHN
ncbi:hypothetical protein F53441_8294 [Fusarium austroafricanum]|uniref:Uncharacterized protein n=1 Tax=Fusarium austroafricanum TaxID=2364996 RepID=A0A8H4NXH2_9HYPO|nr:hypothetical protein F53441_8294 [Fusarium austroafricanum]